MQCEQGLNYFCVFGGGGKGGNHSRRMNVVAHNTGPLISNHLDPRSKYGPTMVKVECVSLNDEIFLLFMRFS